MDGMEVLSESHLRRWEDSTALTGDSDALRAAVERDGFLYCRGLVPPERVAALRAVVLDHARRVSWLDPRARIEDGRAWPGRPVGGYEERDWIALQARVQTSPELWGVGDAPELHGVLRTAFGRRSFLFLGMNTCRAVSPHPELTTRPHQDAHYVRLPDAFVTVWVPLGDCPLALGPLAVLPGSHRRGLLPHHGHGIIDGGLDVEDDAVWYTGDFACGDALVLTRHTIHRALPNRSGDRLRLSVDLRYGFRVPDAG